MTMICRCWTYSKQRISIQLCLFTTGSFPEVPTVVPGEVLSYAVKARSQKAIQQRQMDLSLSTMGYSKIIRCLDESGDPWVAQSVDHMTQRRDHIRFFWIKTTSFGDRVTFAYIFLKDHVCMELTGASRWVKYDN